MNSLTGSIDMLAGVSTFITLVVGVLSIFVFYFRGKKAVKQHVSKQVGALSLQISMGDQVLGERIASTEKLLETATQDLGGKIDTVEHNFRDKIATETAALGDRIDHMNQHLQILDHRVFALGTRWGAWSEGPEANRKPQQTIPERRQTNS